MLRLQVHRRVEEVAGHRLQRLVPASWHCAVAAGVQARDRMARSGSRLPMGGALPQRVHAALHPTMVCSPAVASFPSYSSTERNDRLRRCCANRIIKKGLITERGKNEQARKGQKSIKSAGAGHTVGLSSLCYSASARKNRGRVLRSDLPQNPPPPENRLAQALVKV